MAYIFASAIHSANKELQFEFLNTAVLSAGERAYVWWNGIVGNEWYPTYPAIYSGQIKCLVSVTDVGGGSQSYGASNTEEDNILFEFVGGVGTIAHIHQYFKHSDANMNGTWIFSVNPTNQGIQIQWEAPSGALNTTFEMKCIANVLELKL